MRLPGKCCHSYAGERERRGVKEEGEALVESIWKGRAEKVVGKGITNIKDAWGKTWKTSIL